MSLPVRFAPEAERDLLALLDYLAAASSPETAQRYVDDLVAHCASLGVFPNQGTAREDIRPGLRTTGFRRRVLIAFAVRDDALVVLGVHYGGRDSATLLRGAGGGEQLLVAWRAAEVDLGLEPAQALGDAVLVPNFGSDAGMLCTLAEDLAAESSALRELANAIGASYSVLSATYQQYERDVYIATLNDWGWTGPGEPPAWYTGEPWTAPGGDP